MEGRKEGWKEGWMDGRESEVKDCLQQSISYIKFGIENGEELR